MKSAQWHFAKAPPHKYVKATPANENLETKLSVPDPRPPTVATPPADVIDERQMALKEKANTPYCSPDGYPTVILDPDKIKTYENPYSRGEITTRSGVLWAQGEGEAGDEIRIRQFKRSERAAQYRTQHGLPDMRYVAAYDYPAQADSANYYNAKMPKPDYRLAKKGDWWVNGVPYIPKALILREQPALQLFSMADGDPRQPTAQDIANDKVDPEHLTMANSLVDTRSYVRRVDIGNKLQNAKSSWIRSSRIRLIKTQGEYGESLPGFPPTVPMNISAHRKKIMEFGITHHPLKGMARSFSMGSAVTHPSKQGTGTTGAGSRKGSTRSEVDPFGGTGLGAV
jgi:hypothetical protein